MFPLIGWNEQNAVCMEQLFKEMEKTVVEAQCTADPSGSVGKLIVISDCAVKQPKKIEYDMGGGQAVTVPGGYYMERSAKIFAWREEKETKSSKDSVGGGSTKRTRYIYSRRWTDKMQSSDTFHNKNPDNNGGGINPPHADLATLAIGAKNDKLFGASGSAEMKAISTSLDAGKAFFISEAQAATMSTESAACVLPPGTSCTAACVPVRCAVPACPCVCGWVGGPVPWP